MAVKLRMLTVQIKHSAQAMLDPDVSSENREKYVDRLTAAVNEYEQILYRLGQGSEKLGLELLDEHYTEARSQLDHLSDQWQKLQKPLLLKITKWPSEKKDKACAACHTAFKDKPEDIDVFVKSLVVHEEKEIAYYNIIKGIILAVLVSGAGFVVIYVRHTIIKPVRHLLTAADKIEQGVLDTQIAVTTKDEIGDLSRKFNQMAATLSKNHMEQKKTEAMIRQNLQVQDILNALLKISLEKIPLEKILEKALDIILSVPFLPIKPQGGIFLVKDEPDVLVLAAQKGFTAPIQTPCARVPFGKCLCGQAASCRQIQFADCIDDHHDIHYDGMTSHGHYNVPILSMGRVLGVYVVYLSEGHQQLDKESVFLESVADTLAGIIERTQAEDRLDQHSKALLSLADASAEIICADTVSPLFSMICDTAVKIAGLKMAWLGLVDPGPNHDVTPAAHSECSVSESFVCCGNITPVAHTGIEKDFLSVMTMVSENIPADKTPCKIAVKTKKPYLLTADHPDFAPWRKDAEKRNYAAILGVPLVFTSGKCIGALICYSERPGFFIQDRVKILQIFAGHAAIAIENRRLIDGLENTIEKRTKQIEEVNLKLKALVTELKAKNKEAEKLMIQAEAANRAKSDFLANMSHELRTPLNSIIGFSEVIRDGMAGTVTDEQEQYLNDIWESGRHLLRLINDILDLSKIEAGKMQLEISKISIADLIGSSLEMVREKAMKHGVSLTSEPDEDIGTVTADEIKIKQVLLNLLSNALKFTPEGGFTTVKARRITDAQIEISVIDTGIGIAQKDMEKLFRPFEQIESFLTKKHEGTGLGLKLCKDIVALHGGRIWAESTPGQGSRFVFVIPVTQVDHEENIDHRG
ncbi:ATP-binding protein [Desulfotignum phosphitoxidans]|nr:ATP-binding protein [Desulfotignum phosphitoxidans]